MPRQRSGISLDNDTTTRLKALKLAKVSSVDSYSQRYLAMADKTLHKRRHFDVNIPFENSEPVIVKILLEIKPEWSKEKLEFKYFTEGISNKLIGCMLQNGSEKDLIMFRLYGNRTELFIDREQELVNVEFLHARGFAPKLYATFENGYCCGFIPGRTLETEEMSDKHLSALIAKKLARVHAIELPSDFKTGEPCAFSMIEKFLSVLPDKFDDHVKQTRWVLIGRPKMRGICLFYVVL